MLELTPENVVEYLRGRGRLDPAISATAQPLEWGVSNVVLRVHPSRGEDLIVKQSRGRLRTAAEWFSRLERIHREADVMRLLAEILPADTVPPVLFEDRENYVLGMEAVAEDHVVWKEELLQGRTDADIARQAGRLLGIVHRQTCGDAHAERLFADRTNFEELRVDPFYRHMAGAHPDLRPPLENLIDETERTAVCLVLGDFSPKNVLITEEDTGHQSGGRGQESEVEHRRLRIVNSTAGRRLTLVDFETGHWGDPAFDLGFFLSHLLLKTVLHADQSDRFLSLVAAFRDEYIPHPETRRTTDDGQRTNPPDSRIMRHLAGCMLARIDGKSTVDYLPEERQRNIVRRYCRELLLDPPRDLDAALLRLPPLIAAPSPG